MGDFLKIKLIDAAYSNNLEDLDFCFGLGDVDVNCVNDKGVTPLLAAVSSGSIDFIKKLFDFEGLDVNKTATKDKKSPLFIACQKGRKTLVKMLLEHPNIEVNTQDKFTTTAFMVALRGGYDDILTLLLKHPKLDLNQQKQDGMTALMMACNLGRTKVVKELLRNKDIDITLTDKKGMTAKDIATKKKNKDIMAAFDDKARMEQSRSRVFSSNKNFRDYQMSISRGSFLSQLSVEEMGANLKQNEKKSSFKETKKGPKNIMSQMIRMQSNFELDNEMKTEVPVLSKTILRKKKNKETAKAEVKEEVKGISTTEVSPSLEKKRVEQDLTEVKPEEDVNTREAIERKQEVETVQPGAEVVEVKEKVDQETSIVETTKEGSEEKPEPETSNDLVRFLLENGAEELAKVVSEKKVRSLYVWSKMTDFELTHDLGLTEPQKKILKKVLDEHPEKAKPPARKYRFCFVSVDPPTSTELNKIEGLEKKEVPVDDLPLQELLFQVEEGHCFAVVFSGEGFFRNPSNLAALCWGVMNKIEIVGLNVAENQSPSSILFKMLLRTGHGLLKDEEWKALQALDIGYPNVYDALETLSKSMASSLDDLKSKLQA